MAEFTDRSRTVVVRYGLRQAGVRRITVRLDKGFFGKRIVARMEELGVSYLLKVPRHAWLDGVRGTWRTAARNEAGGRELRTSSGELWGTRLLSVERRKRIGPEEGELDLAAWETTTGTDVPTNVGDIGPGEAWRGRRAADRRAGPAQLSAGRTAVDDVGGNALLWRLALLAYQLLHILRSNAPRQPLARRPAARYPAAPCCARPRGSPPTPAAVSLRFASAEPALGLLRLVLRAIELGLPSPRPARPVPNRNLPKAPDGGGTSPCLREPPGRLAERSPVLPAAPHRLEDAALRHRTAASTGHNQALGL